MLMILPFMVGIYLLAALTGAYRRFGYALLILLVLMASCMIWVLLNDFQFIYFLLALTVFWPLFTGLIVRQVVPLGGGSSSIRRRVVLGLGLVVSLLPLAVVI